MLARGILLIAAVAGGLLCDRGPVLAADAASPAPTTPGTSTPAATGSLQPTGDPTTDAEGRARDAGIVEGQIVSVDYQKGMLSVQTPNRGRIDVLVLPSTSIQGKGNSYRSIADLIKGERISIFASQVAGRYTAQIIRLR